MKKPKSNRWILPARVENILDRILAMLIAVIVGFFIYNLTAIP